MSSSVFNSVYETSMRLVLLLNTFDCPLSSEELFVFDFIATYGKEFGLTDVSLNGDSEFTLSKATLRRKRVMEAISYLVRNGYITLIAEENETKYELTERGNEFYKKISQTGYSEKYILTVELGKKELFYKGNKALDLILARIKEDE